MKKSKKLFISLLIVALIIATLLGFKACANKKEEIIREPVIQEPVAQDSTLEQGTTVQEPIVEVVEEKKEENVIDKTTLSYWVNFLNKDGSVLQRTVYEYGSTPSYKGETPTYNDYAYYYSFKGWDKAISSVTGTQTYTAQYDITGEVPHKSSNTTTPELAPNYLTFTANHDSGISSIIPKFVSGSYEYSTDGVNWIQGTNDGTTTITLNNSGDKVMLRGIDCVTSDGLTNCSFDIGGKIQASGDVTSLTNGIGGDVALTDYCYAYMFNSCGSLVTPPSLPSTTLAQYCYKEMFSNTAITSAPNLPSTNLVEGCYKLMFNSCSLLNVSEGEPASYDSIGIIFTCQTDNDFNEVDRMFNGTTKRLNDFDATPTSGSTYYWYKQNSCFSAGTKIAMSNMSTKNIEDIVVGDSVLNYNHEKGLYEVQKVNLVYKSDYTNKSFTLHFEDGTKLSIVGLHDLFEKESLKYVVISENNANDFIGKHFYNCNSNSYVELTNVTYNDEKTEFYSIYTDYNYNCIAEGMLSIPDDVDEYLNFYKFNTDLSVDMKQLNRDIDKYGLYEYPENAIYPKEAFDTLRIKYINIMIGKGLITLDALTSLRDEYFGE